MSYINEALKKAQEERDSCQSIFNYISDESDRRKRRFGGILLWCSISVLLFIGLVYGAYAWLEPSHSRMVPETGPDIPTIAGLKDEQLGNRELYEKASNLFNLGRFQEAKKLYEAVVEMDPGYVDALNNLGVIYIHDGNFDAAKENLEKAVRLDPAHVESYYNMACMYSIKGEIKQGLEYFKRAISLEKDVRGWAMVDSDLQNLKTMDEFNKLLSDTTDN
jgi:tetratricopeptide (TPR) repeat protein